MSRVRVKVNAYGPELPERMVDESHHRFLATQPLLLPVHLVFAVRECQGVAEAQREPGKKGISVERQRYNERVQEYNTSRRTFPANVTNAIFRFQDYPLFTAPESAKVVPKVDFSRPATNRSP